MEEIITLQEVKAFPALTEPKGLLMPPVSVLSQNNPRKAPWPSYFLHSHFRIIFPSTPGPNSRCFHRSKESVGVRNCVLNLLSLYVLRWDVVSPSPKYQAGEPPTEGCPPLCIEIFTNNFHICRPSLPCATELRAKPWWQGINYQERDILIPITQINSLITAFYDTDEQTENILKNNGKFFMFKINRH